MLLTCISRQISRLDPIGKKLVVVGDGECGKTCLLQRFVKGEFTDDGYLPTVFEVDVAHVLLEKTPVALSLYDTAGQECYDRLRPISYVDANVVLIVFSIDNPDSLTNVIDKWTSEVRHFCGDVPVILVGTKSDVRNTSEDSDDDSSVNSCRLIKEGPIKYEQGERAAKIIGAVRYMECSAKENTGVKDIFHEATQSCFMSKKKRKKLFSAKKVNKDNFIYFS